MPSHLPSTPATTLPKDSDQAILLGRVWNPNVDGPMPVLCDGRTLYDISAIAPTISQILQIEGLMARLGNLDSFPAISDLATVLTNTHPAISRKNMHLLAPNDLQAIKASGVTFVASLLERVIEEQARGDAANADQIRSEILSVLGGSLSDIVPGSPNAQQIKDLLIEKKAWSQYLEVGIGPDAEIFTKAPVLSAVGHGSHVGIHPASTWNNPEPEIVLVMTSTGKIVGATLGNDVNLRDIEGRSALLLGKAKDNNGSCAIGPFIRLFDDRFTLDDIKSAEIAMSVDGKDGYHLEAVSSMSQISRPPESLVAQTMGTHHQYPDGFMLFLGTMFAPTDDRDGTGQGFTHKPGDIVTIATPKLGSLINEVGASDTIPRWDFGIGALIRNLAQRGLL